jgi:hypothetical protein
MACFAVTTVAAVGVAVARHIVKHNEKKAEKNEVVSVNADTLKTSKKLKLQLGHLFPFPSSIYFFKQ